MTVNAMRLAYVVEYLISIVAILNLWEEVGGPSHLDLISWYTKLGLTLGLATAIVMATASAVATERAWNARTIAWSLASLAFVCAIGAATYYAHLHENDDAGQEEEKTPIAYLTSSTPLTRGTFA